MRKAIVSVRDIASVDLPTSVFYAHVRTFQVEFPFDNTSNIRFLTVLVFSECLRTSLNGFVQFRFLKLQKIQNISVDGSRICSTIIPAKH